MASTATSKPPAQEPLLVPDWLGGPMITEQLERLTPASACQLFYVLATVLVLGITIMPESAKELLLAYGARLAPSSASNNNGKSNTSNSSGPGDGKAAAAAKGVEARGVLVSLLSWATSIGQVPHSWFAHFYVVSVTCSVFWAAQYVTHGRILDFAASRGASTQFPSSESSWSSLSSSTTKDQAILTWFLMSLQGGRRLYESWFVMRSSSSRMWFVHWALGIAFYFFTGIAVWAEGCHAILNADHRSPDFEIPSFKTVLGTVSFLAAWVMQNRCHVHLANLKRYSLPSEGLFKFIVSPHYTCECAIYLSLAVVASPQNQAVNRTLLCALMFVACNLGATAGGTKRWYAKKFGAESVRGKWKMIPLIY